MAPGAGFHGRARRPLPPPFVAPHLRSNGFPLTQAPVLQLIDLAAPFFPTLAELGEFAPVAAREMPADYQAKYTMKGYSTPVVNGKAQTELAQAALVQQLGADKVLPGMPPLMGSEDFHMLASPYPDTKVLFLEVGSGKPEVYKNLVEKKQLPPAMNHTPGFVVELPAISTGARAVSATLSASISSSHLDLGDPPDHDEADHFESEPHEQHHGAGRMLDGLVEVVGVDESQQHRQD